MPWTDARDPTTLALAMLGYACLLAALLLAVNLMLNRVTRDERHAERHRRQTARLKRKPDA